MTRNRNHFTIRSVIFIFSFARITKSRGKGKREGGGGTREGGETRRGSEEGSGFLSYLDSDHRHKTIVATAKPLSAPFSALSMSERFFCPHAGCRRSFAELWRLKVHCRAPPDVRGSGRERGHGEELKHCPRCQASLQAGRHHVGCSKGPVAPRQAMKRMQVIKLKARQGVGCTGKRRSARRAETSCVWVKVRACQCEPINRRAAASSYTLAAAAILRLARRVFCSPEYAGLSLESLRRGVGRAAPLGAPVWRVLTHGI